MFSTTQTYSFHNHVQRQIQSAQALNTIISPRFRDTSSAQEIVMTIVYFCSKPMMRLFTFPQMSNLSSYIADFGKICCKLRLQFATLIELEVRKAINAE